MCAQVSGLFFFFNFFQKEKEKIHKGGVWHTSGLSIYSFWRFFLSLQQLNSSNRFLPSSTIPWWLLLSFLLFLYLSLNKKKRINMKKKIFFSLLNSFPAFRLMPDAFRFDSSSSSVPRDTLHLYFRWTGRPKNLVDNAAWSFSLIDIP